MAEDTRKLLKIFGVKVTDFEEKSREIVGKAQEAAKERGVDALLPLFEDLIILAMDLNKWWLEVTQRILEVRHNAYSEMIRILGEIKKLKADG
ncbi:MAG: hypothetical protein ACK4Z6_05890 [Candidatus Methylomirabilales bacterium]